MRANTGLKTVITVAVGDASGATLPSPPVDALLGESVSFAEALAQGGGLPLQPVALTGDDLLFLQYTGGTTGLSKGACLSHRNLVANTEQYKAMMPSALRDGQEVILTAIPLYHIMALMVNFITYFSVGADNWLVGGNAGDLALPGPRRRRSRPRPGSWLAAKSGRVRSGKGRVGPGR